MQFKKRIIFRDPLFPPPAFLALKQNQNASLTIQCHSSLSVKLLISQQPLLPSFPPLLLPHPFCLSLSLNYRWPQLIKPPLFSYNVSKTVTLC